MFWIYLITPTLGLTRNYVKYKQLRLSLFMRTPLVCMLFHIWFCMNGHHHVFYKSLIYERWFWFVIKTIRSYLNGDYLNKRAKYEIKYKLTYPGK